MINLYSFILAAGHELEEAVEHAANGEGGGGHEGGNEHLFNIVHFASEALHQQWIAD